MSAYSSRASRILLGMMVAFLIAGLPPAASAGEGQKNDDNSKNAEKQKMQDTEMPSDMAASDTAQEGKKPKVIKADKMNKKKLRAELEAASDDTVVEYKGKKTTKKQLKLDAEKQAKEDQAAMQAPATAASDPNAVISQFNQQEKTKLEAANAKVRTEMTRLLSAGPAAEGAAGQANPAAGSPIQRSIDAPVRAAPMEPNVR